MQNFECCMCEYKDAPKYFIVYKGKIYCYKCIEKRAPCVCTGKQKSGGRDICDWCYDQLTFDNDPYY